MGEIVHGPSVVRELMLVLPSSVKKTEKKQDSVLMGPSMGMGVASFFHSVYDDFLYDCYMSSASDMDYYDDDEEDGEEDYV